MCIDVQRFHVFLTFSGFTVSEMTLSNLMQKSRFQTLWFDVYLSRQRSVPETQT